MRGGTTEAVRRRFTEVLAGLDDQARSAPGRPVPISPFVGREREITTVTRRLTAGRLTSLVGPRGAGKTRLILEVLRRRPPGSGVRARYVTAAAEGIDDVLP